MGTGYQACGSKMAGRVSLASMLYVYMGLWPSAWKTMTAFFFFFSVAAVENVSGDIVG